jgi:hypothetical protein
MKSTRWILLVLLGVLAFSRPNLAQEAVWAFRQATPGWIGLRFDFARARVGQEERTVAVIREVIQGSPAQAQGLRAGDTLTHLDGQFITQEAFSTLSRSLEPGDLVRLTARRDGRSRDILVEAAAPPENLVISPDARRVVVELEALSGNILKNLDSLRLSIGRLAVDSSGQDLTLHVLRVPDSAGKTGAVGYQYSFSVPFADSLGVFVDSLGIRTGGYVFTPETPVPFASMIVESEATRELRGDLSRIRRELTAVRQEELARRHELASSSRGSIEEALQRDERILEMREREKRLVSEQERIARRLQEVSEEELQRQWVSIQSQNEEALLRARWSARQGAEAQARRAEEEEVRARLWSQQAMTEFTSPVMMGQSFIMGAQVAPLNSDLAQYFPVDQGVFVVQVVDGTPAAEAGLQGGDIIVGVDEEEVTSLSELRFGLAANPGPWTIHVVRKSGSVEIVIKG